MGNKLQQAPQLPELWMRTLLVDRFKEIKGYFHSLPSTTQAQIVKIANRGEIFQMDESIRKTLLQTWNTEMATHTKEEIEKVVEDVIVYE